MSADNPDYKWHPVPTNRFRYLRACMVCAIVLTLDEFTRKGCPNCHPVLDYISSQDLAQECTSPIYEGCVSIDKPTESWIAKWLRLTKYVPGVYATKVVGELSTILLTRTSSTSHATEARTTWNREPGTAPLCLRKRGLHSLWTPIISNAGPIGIATGSRKTPVTKTTLPSKKHSLSDALVVLGHARTLSFPLKHLPRTRHLHKPPNPKLQLFLQTHLRPKLQTHLRPEIQLLQPDPGLKRQFPRPDLNPKPQLLQPNLDPEPQLLYPNLDPEPQPLHLNLDPEFQLLPYKLPNQLKPLQLGLDPELQLLMPARASLNSSVQLFPRKHLNPNPQLLLHKFLNLELQLFLPSPDLKLKPQKSQRNKEAPTATDNSVSNQRNKDKGKSIVSAIPQNATSKLPTVTTTEPPRTILAQDISVPTNKSENQPPKQKRSTLVNNDLKTVGQDPPPKKKKSDSEKAAAELQAGPSTSSLQQTTFTTVRKTAEANTDTQLNKKKPDSASTEPKATEPKPQNVSVHGTATRPKTAEPKVAESKASESKAAESDAADPKTAEPKIAEPNTAHLDPNASTSKQSSRPKTTPQAEPSTLSPNQNRATAVGDNLGGASDTQSRKKTTAPDTSVAEPATQAGSSRPAPRPKGKESIAPKTAVSGPAAQAEPSKSAPKRKRGAAADNVEVNVEAEPSPPPSKKKKTTATKATVAEPAETQAESSRSASKRKQAAVVDNVRIKEEVVPTPMPPPPPPKRKRAAAPKTAVAELAAQAGPSRPAPKPKRGPVTHIVKLLIKEEDEPAEVQVVSSRSVSKQKRAAVVDNVRIKEEDVPPPLPKNKRAAASKNKRAAEVQAESSKSASKRKRADVVDNTKVNREEEDAQPPPSKRKKAAAPKTAVAEPAQSGSSRSAPKPKRAPVTHVMEIIVKVED
ncbi:transcription elongation factor spt4 [Orbilia brochopaga]|uniref:Transcription elongation factor SPT4 n=1 Tax=Orbilia brochopaga TaxID=3140254 RepID=A0AAV9V462_9PEZI